MEATDPVMSSIYQLKPAFQALLRPFTRALAEAGVTANEVTSSAVLVSFGSGVAIAATRGARWALLILPAALLARMALNAIDGMLAREHGQKSPLGALLNELGDVVSDAALYLPLALVPGFAPGLVVGIVLLAGLGEMAGALGPMIGASRRYDGPMGKSDRAFVLGLVALLLGLGVPPSAWLLAVQVAILVLLLLTVRNRVAHALAEVRPR